MTQDGGGSGPWVFLVSPDPENPKTARLRTVMGLRPEEDLWLELVFYPNRTRMRAIIRRIWKEPRFALHAEALDGLISKRKVGYAATLAYASLKQI
jgi:hypothetical protein